MAKLPEPGISNTAEYEIKGLRLITGSGQAIDIDQQKVEIVVNQSIDSPFMYGTVLIVDARDILANFAVSGNDYLEINIDQPSLGIPFNRKFRVFKVSNRKQNNNAGAVLTIHFISNEAVMSSSMIISKAYKQKTTSEIVSDILKDILAVKRPVKIESTTGVYDVIIPSYRPVEAIYWLAGRSFNASAGSFHFYESGAGFNFISLQQLFKQSPVQGRTFTYDVKNANEEPGSGVDLQRNRSSFESFLIEREFDVIETMSKGGFASSLLAVNVIERSTELYTYSLNDTSGKLLNKSPPIKDEMLTTSYTSMPKVQVKTTKTSTDFENEVDKWLLPRISHKALLDNMRIRATLPGDITLNAGDVINVNFPKFVAADDEGKEFDAFRSGKYLIADLTNIYAQDGTFKTILYIVTDSFSQELPTPKKNIHKAAT